MATGGARQSKTFDIDGRDLEGKPRQHEANQASPLNLSCVTVAAVCLRIMQLGFAVAALGVMASNKPATAPDWFDFVFYGDYLPIPDSFSHVHSFVAVVAVNCVVCFYALVQLVLCLVSCCVNLATEASCLSSSIAAFLIFLFDTLLAIVLVGITAWGAYSAEHFAHGTRGSDFCYGVTSFCVKAIVSVSLSFIAFVFLVVTAIMYLVRFMALARAH